MNDLTNAERETIISQSADNRDAWHVFSDDPVTIRRLEKLGATRLVTRAGSAEFELRADQLLIRRGKRSTSEAQRGAARQRMIARHTATVEAETA